MSSLKIAYGGNPTPSYLLPKGELGELTDHQHAIQRIKDIGPEQINYIVPKYTVRAAWKGLSEQTLIEEGRKAFIHCLALFDISRKCSLFTLAYAHIKGAIERRIQRQRPLFQPTVGGTSLITIDDKDQLREIIDNLYKITHTFSNRQEGRRLDALCHHAQYTPPAAGKKLLIL